MAIIKPFMAKLNKMKNTIVDWQIAQITKYTDFLWQHKLRILHIFSSNLMMTMWRIHLLCSLLKFQMKLKRLSYISISLVCMMAQPRGKIILSSNRSDPFWWFLLAGYFQHVKCKIDFRWKTWSSKESSLPFVSCYSHPGTWLSSDNFGISPESPLFAHAICIHSSYWPSPTISQSNLSTCNFADIDIFSSQPQREVNNIWKEDMRHFSVLILSTKVWL